MRICCCFVFYFWVMNRVKIQKIFEEIRLSTYKAQKNRNKTCLWVFMYVCPSRHLGLKPLHRFWRNLACEYLQTFFRFYQISKVQQKNIPGKCSVIMLRNQLSSRIFSKEYHKIFRKPLMILKHWYNAMVTNKKILLNHFVHLSA